MVGDTCNTGATGSESDSGASTETGSTENVYMQGGDMG